MRKARHNTDCVLWGGALTSIKAKEGTKEKVKKKNPRQAKTCSVYNRLMFSIFHKWIYTQYPQGEMATGIGGAYKSKGEDQS